MSKNKKQHFLPQFYLRGFAQKQKIDNDPKKISEFVWRYNIKNKDLKNRGVGNIAWKSHCYSFINDDGTRNDSLEKYFSRLETDADRVFRKIDRNIDNLDTLAGIEYFTAEEKKTLVEFVYWQMKRIPLLLDKIIDAVRKMFKDIGKKYKVNYDDNKIRNKMLEVMLKIGSSEDPKRNFMKILFSKNVYLFYINNSDISFITSDNPVVGFNKSSLNGIGNESTEIYFPISYRCLLMFYGKGSKISFTPLNDNKKIYELDKHIASKAYELIIAKDKELLSKIIEESGFVDKKMEMTFTLTQ